MLSTPRRTQRRTTHNSIGEATPPSTAKKTRHRSLSKLKDPSLMTPAKADLVERKQSTVRETSPVKPRSLGETVTNAIASLFGVKSSDTPAIPRPVLVRQDSSALAATLPSHYEILLKQFRAVEEVLQIMKTRHSVAFLVEVGRNVSDATKHRFNLARMQQILTICKGTLKLEWKEVGQEFQHPFSAGMGSIMTSSGIRKEAVIYQTDPSSGQELHDRFNSTTTQTRKEFVLNELLKRVESARLTHKTSFDPETDCPPIEGVSLENIKPASSNQPEPFSTPKKNSLRSVASDLKASQSSTPTRLSLGLSASPITPLQLPQLPMTPKATRDASLTPREQIDAMRERVRQREASEGKQAKLDEEDQKKKAAVKEFDDMLAMVAQISKKFYQSASSQRLDMFVKETNKMSIRFSSATEVERLIKRLSQVAPQWLQLIPSEFSKDTILMKVDNNYPIPSVQKTVKLLQEQLLNSV